MIRPRVIAAVAAMSFREYVRTPEAMFWAYSFPLIMALGLGLAFARGEPEPVRVVVPDDVEQGAGLCAALEHHGGARVLVERLPRPQAGLALARGEFDLLLGGDLAEPVVELDPTRPSSELARFHVERALALELGQEQRVRPRIEPVTDPGDRYIDFLIPGLVGLNLLGAGLYGVGYHIAHMRVKNQLRRLCVTPMRRSEFLLAFVISRIVMALPSAVVIVLFGALVFGVPVHGSALLVLALVTLGAVAFSGLGLLVASRARTLEAVSGLMNLVMVPMWLLGGCFFSNQRFPELLQPLVQLVPLTHLNDALREVMLGGAGLAEVAVPIGILAAFTLACLGLAVKVFRWT